MRIYFYLTLSALLLSLASCGLLIRMSNEAPSIELKNGKAYVNGVLGKQFHKQFVAFIKNHPDIKDVVLENVPGSINDEWNAKTCILLHKQCMNTHLTSSSEIASGGVDLFVAGNRRTIEPGARIGVHSWRDGKRDGIEYPKEAEEHDLFIEMYNAIDVDTAFYWFTLKAAPANDIHWMTEDEIVKYNFRTEKECD